MPYLCLTGNLQLFYYQNGTYQFRPKYTLSCSDGHNGHGSYQILYKFHMARLPHITILDVFYINGSILFCYTVSE